jgi:hypothetical protein
MVRASRRVAQRALFEPRRGALRRHAWKPGALLIASPRLGDEKRDERVVGEPKPG